MRMKDDDGLWPMSRPEDQRIIHDLTRKSGQRVRELFGREISTALALDTLGPAWATAFTMAFDAVEACAAFMDTIGGRCPEPGHPPTPESMAAVAVGIFCVDDEAFYKAIVEALTRRNAEEAVERRRAMQ